MHCECQCEAPDAMRRLRVGPRRYGAVAPGLSVRPDPARPAQQSEQRGAHCTLALTRDDMVVLLMLVRRCCMR